MTRPPPLLLGATLLFWGWQTGLLAAGAVMGLVLEGARVIKTRWEFSNDDFQRIWTFCTILLLAALVYAFTANQGPADFRDFIQNPSYSTQRDAGTASSRTAAAVVRWLPMIFFLFVGAQCYSSREAIPLETISLILRRRWQQARKLGQPVPATQSVNVSYAYFLICLFAACVRAGEGATFFWGLCALVPWALWPVRPRRYGLVVWTGTIAVSLALGYFGQLGIGQLTRYVEKFNPQILAWFSKPRFEAHQSRTQLGNIGRIKNSGKIVLRLETPPATAPPPLLREASYRTYKEQAWNAETPRNSFEVIPSEPNQTTWVLVPGKTNRSAVNIACYLPGGNALLPLPSGSGRLENLFAFGLKKNILGAVVAQGPGLVMFDAWYAPGVSIDSTPAATSDLAVPPLEEPALDQIVAELKLAEESHEQALRTLQAFFAEKFNYSTWQKSAGDDATNSTPLSHFLLRTRSGHCEYFATATVLLLRKLNIPARYAVGYAVHEAASRRKFVVRQRDAHAWCLVWNPQTSAWDDFDTTPAGWIEAENRRASPLQFLSDLWSRLSFEVSKLRWGQTRLRQYLLLTLVPILVVLLYQIIFRRRGRKRHGMSGKAVAEDWPGRDSEFYQVAKRVEELAGARHPGEPLSLWLARAIAATGHAGVREALQRVLDLHYRYRFDPQGLSPAEREALRHQTAACLTRLRAELP